MAMDASVLQAALKTDFMQVFDACSAGSGMSQAEYADMMAEAIASRVIEHITDKAVVTGTAGPYPVQGTVS